MPGRFRQVNEARPCGRAAEDGRASAAKIPPVPPPLGDKPAAHALCLRTTKKTPAALVSSAVQVSCLAPRSSRSPSASCLLGRPFLPMADFRPGGIAASVHPCAHSAVRVGFFAPFLSGRHLAVSGLCGARRTASSDMIRLSGFVTPQNHPYHTASGRKSQRPAPCKTALCPRGSGGREKNARRRTSPWEPCRAKPPGGMRPVYADQPSAAARRRSSSA